jgi:hypothetical protein
MKLKVIEINDAHWMHDYDCKLTVREKKARLRDRLENAGIDLAMIYFVVFNTAYPGQPESLYVRATVRTPSESVSESMDIGEAFVSAAL